MEFNIQTECSHLSLSWKRLVHRLVLDGEHFNYDEEVPFFIHFSFLKQENRMKRVNW